MARQLKMSACRWYTFAMTISRRQFLLQCGAVGLGFVGLRAFLNERDGGGAASAFADANPLIGYGDLIPDPGKIFDLPRGFSYQVISRQGDEMSDGLLVPGAFDGMCAFAGTAGKTILVRNHELEVGEGAFGKDAARLTPAITARLYDAGHKSNPGAGGTTTLVYDPKTGKLDQEFLSLAGTHRNCAGGPTPWGSWITCEETAARQGDAFTKDHGYNFEVPAREDGVLQAPIPLREMGRFRHEAVAVGAKTGIVYQTEDRDDGLIYRFIPAMPRELARGGRLQMLKIKDQPSADTRNWEKNDFKVGDKISVEWLNCENSEDHNDDLRARGFDKGAARFARGEGMWAASFSDGDAIYFVCTNGGEKRKGQIWRYFPSRFEGTSREKDEPGRLELFSEPNDGNIVENADNLTIAPWGDAILCEDAVRDENPGQFLVGVTPRGQHYRLGRNALNNAELAGVTFSPDGSTLFVNIYNPGHTLAIVGPWGKV